MAIHTSVKNAVESKLSDVTMNDAIAEFKNATSNIYDAVSSVGSATAANAKVRLNEGKARALELEGKAEELVRAQPLVTVGAAFVVGWLVSSLLRR